MVQILAYPLFLIIPALLVLLADRVDWAGRIGPIVLCYAAGLLLGLSGLLPESTYQARSTVSEVSLGLALPLLLFSVDIRAWGQVAGRAMLSMFCAVVAVVAIATGLFYVFSAQGMARVEELSALAVGMYTGGIANLASIKLALGIPDERFLLFATVDTVVGGFYLLFVLSLAPKLFAPLLPAFSKDRAAVAEFAEIPDATTFDMAALPSILVALLAAGACVGLAVGLAPLLSFAEPQIVVIVLLTTVGLLASLIPALARNRHAPRIGMYLIYVFSFCVAAAMDLTALRGMDLSVLAFILMATFGGLSLHALLCRLFGIDRDTFLITSVAALMSPAFVPMVARSLNNPAVLMSGMVTGILGFAIGNYLGISVALLLAR